MDVAGPAEAGAAEGAVVVRPQRAGPILPTVIAIMSQQTAATRIIAAGKPSFFLHKELDNKIV